MHTLKTFVVEDEPIVKEEIIWHVNNHTQLELVGNAASVKEALVAIPHVKPDLVLFDIQLLDGTSFEILNHLPTLNFKFIFITAFDQHAIKAIRYGAFDYLLKPLNEEEFYQAIERLQKTPNKILPTQVKASSQVYEQEALGMDDIISIASVDFIQVVRLKDIMFCESDSSYTLIYLQDKRKITASKTLKFYEEVLSETHFLRCHQSFLVNKLYIDKYLKTGYLLLKNGKNIPVSVRKKDYVLNRLSSL
ncbi:MAG: LytR/AlgR family response regulator transcription factor [Thermonemataceae bacterium]